MKLKHRHRGTSKRGASAVEFALVAPLLFLFVFGMIEIGRMVMVQQVLTNATREGARLAAMPDATETDVETRVTTFSAQAGVPSVTADVSPNPTSAVPGDTINVTASVAISDVGWLPVNVFFPSGSLTSATVMRKEGLE